MLERDVLIDGNVWSLHDVALVTLVPDQHVIVAVRSTRRNDDENHLIETSHTLTWADGMTMAEIEQAVWALPEMEEYVDKGEILNDVLDILTDEQAETMPQLYPEWKTGVEYAIGKRVRYDGKLYRCVQAHTSQEGWEPPNVPAIWTRTAPDGEIPEWVQPTGAQDAYNKGDKVRYEGSIYESTVDGNVWSPTDYPQGWQKVE